MLSDLKDADGATVLRRAQGEAAAGQNNKGQDKWLSEETNFDLSYH